MIINNYTGDRLNFGLAIEMAKNIHKYDNIKAITVDDDCSIDNPRFSVGRRGLTAINLIIKIAGAMSARGCSLNEIHEKCKSLLSERLIRTIGFSFHHHGDVLNDIEIGYGIHGEHGTTKIEKARNFKSIIEIMFKKLKLVNKDGSKIILLFNNLGGASEFIFNVFIREFLDNCGNLKVIKIYAGKFLTSLGTEGIGVSVMKIKNDELIKYLDDTVDVPAKELFNSPFEEICESPRAIINYQIPSSLSQQREEKCMTSVVVGSIKECEIELAKKIVAKICEGIIEARQVLNDMDSELGDADTGSTISRGAEGILENFKSLKFDNPRILLVMLSEILMNVMGGTSGAIFSIFFQFASKAFVPCNEYSIANWKQALFLGMNGIMEYGKACIGDRTLLDSLNAGYEEISDTKSNLITDVVLAFANGCSKGAESTKFMKPKSGRASYSLSDNGDDSKFSSTFPDPGSYAIALISNTILECINM